MKKPVKMLAKVIAIKNVLVAVIKNVLDFVRDIVLIFVKHIVKLLRLLQKILALFQIALDSQNFIGIMLPLTQQSKSQQSSGII